MIPLDRRHYDTIETNAPKSRNTTSRNHASKNSFPENERKTSSVELKVTKPTPLNSCVSRSLSHRTPVTVPAALKKFVAVRPFASRASRSGPAARMARPAVVERLSHAAMRGVVPPSGARLRSAPAAIRTSIAAAWP